VRATSHARVDGRAEVSVRGRVEFRCVLERVRVRRTPAGPLRSIQLEASRGHAGDATPVAPIRCDTPGDGRLRRLGSGLPPVLERRRVGRLLEQLVHGLGHPPEMPNDQPHHARVLVESPSEGSYLWWWWKFEMRGHGVVF